MSTDLEIEKEIREKGLVAPRVTVERIEDAIGSTYYFTAADGVHGAGIPGKSCYTGFMRDLPGLSLVTFCVLILQNGFKVTGESACVSPDNFDAEVGKKVARENAVAKLWQLEGYLLKEKLSKGEAQ